MLKADYGIENVEKGRLWKLPMTLFSEDILGSRRLKNAFKLIFTSLACKVMLLVSTDHVMYVRR